MVVPAAPVAAAAGAAAAKVTLMWRLLSRYIF